MTPPASESILLTGCGWVTPFARGSWKEILTAAARSEPAPTAHPGYAAVPDAWRDEHRGLSNELKRDKGAWMTAIALEYARQSAGLKQSFASPERVGLVVGSALAGMLGMIEFADEVREQSARFVSPIHFPQTVGNYLAGALARGFGLRGASVTLSSGPASGLDAIVEGCSLLACGAADVVFAGGSDRLSKALAEGLVAPGAVLSEGACLFVLERAGDATARGARPLATVTGSGHCTGGELSGSAARAQLVSSAGFRRPGGVYIEHWTGRCQGAASAAAVAAVVGAARGISVPIVDASDAAVVQVGPFPRDQDRDEAGAGQAVVIADADGAHQTVLELVVPTNSP